MRDTKIVSIHGYNSSHGTGFEEAIRETFSGKSFWNENGSSSHEYVGMNERYDFRAIDLLGHKEGRDFPEFKPLEEVIERAINDISSLADENTILIGFSFGGYPVLEYLSRKPNVLGAVLIKPMIDAPHTISQYRSKFKGVTHLLRPEEAMAKYTKGTEGNPFRINTPMLVFCGANDKIVGDVDFINKRVIGKNVRYSILEGGHYDTKESDTYRYDIRRVVGRTLSFVSHLIDSDNPK